MGLRETLFFDHGCVQAAIINLNEPRSAPVTALVFRGTDGWRDWLANVQVYPLAREGAGRVHRGFKRALDGVWERVSQALGNVETDVVYTGHSLGGALATIAASRRPPAALYTFGSPRVGDARFARGLDELSAFRIENGMDIVAAVPPAFGSVGFHHVGRRHGIALHEKRSGRRRRGDPPPRLSDHAPVNYVAALERQLDERATS